MRKEIISLGGEVRFSSKFVGFERVDENTVDIKIENNNNNYLIRTNALILAIGHSSRDTFRILKDINIPMVAKSFAVGLRIEHPSELINKGQYGDSNIAKKLPTADYKMTYHSSEGRGVYSFCMCPGGFVVNASSDENQSVVNGMSNHARDSRNSNSAIVVTVTPEDFFKEGFEKDDALSGMYFQEKYEQRAFELGKGKIPISTFSSFMENNECKKLGEVVPCIKGEYCLTNLNNCLPEYINNAIIEGIIYYDKKLKGFALPDAVLSGIESRTSSPVRILRNERLMSEEQGIFPCGEGSGFAGGITSSAVDGMKVAQAVAEYLQQI